MIFKKLNSALSNQRGFTLVELMIVMGIFGIIAAIALQQVALNRAKALDTKVIALVKNTLTTVAIDEPTGASSFGFGGTLAGIGLPQLEVPDGVAWKVDNIDNFGAVDHDMWLFWFAHEKGKRGYYFWIPGDRCGAVADSATNISDFIFYDQDSGGGSPYRTAAGV